VDLARRNQVRAIFDLSTIDPETVGRALLQADAAADAVDLKVSADFLLDPRCGDFLKETGISRVWFELHPLLADGAPQRILRKAVELQDEITAIPIVGDIDLVTRIVKEFPAIRDLALKGNEAAGFVGSETLFVLYSAVRELVRDWHDAPDLSVWGGIATPEAAAAFIATGAQAIVFESLHWLTDLVTVDDALRRRISNLRPDHTELTGANLRVPCRLFNKGNSAAVKELRNFAGSLCGSEIRDEQRRFFADRIRKETVHPLASQFGRDELIPLGVEAAFAASFAKRFGSSTEDAVEGFVDAIDERLAAAGDKARAFAESQTAKEMRTGYPFIQGAMSWISDVPEFALKVAEAGGLPTVALGMMDRDTLEKKLGRLPDIMKGKPYAVNVITLQENPFRDVQLAWIGKIRPTFAVIAAGEPSHGAELLAHGIQVIYIAPNEELLKLAFEAGIGFAILEGNEAGGHVGQHSTLTLAQMVLTLKDENPSLFQGRRIILAGGVFNRETAFMAAMLGADAVQMGTSYLTTHEIVDTGALTALYQRMVLESAPGSTVITGEGTGLRVRSLKTARIDAICDLERDFAAGNADETAFRHKIEGLSAGSLFVAARGMDRPDGKPLDEENCIEAGQFMSGACAGALKNAVGIGELHKELAEGRLPEGLPFLGPIREAPAPRPVGIEYSESFGRAAARVSPSARTAPAERIAITAMSVVNALGNSPEEIWANSVAMKSGIIEVPSSKWDHGLFFHPRPRMPEKTYCRVGAFQNIEISRKDLGIPPQDFRTMTDSTKITMWLAKKAVEESRILESDIPPERIAVLISQNSGEAAVTLQDVIIRGAASKIVSAVKKVVPLAEETERAVEEEVKAGRIAIDDTTLLGRLNCSAGGFICNKYGFRGPSFSVSAACATALVALYSAVQMIRNGIIDAAVVGGAEEYLTPMHFLEFSALGALAGLSGVERSPWEASRPFDADRDGMVLGEGGGMIVIERESVARRRGARAHAYITAMGASNNNLGMVESAAITQEIAIRSSFTDTSYGPEGVDLVECHATSTQQGDVEEVHGLKTFFSSNGQTVLTSFKSQIGHTLGASGLNSLIRGVMAMKAGIFPATLNYRTPDPDIAIESSGLVILGEPAMWDKNGSPRRLQVNAFGFGGSNYVVQVEQALEEEDRVLVIPEIPVTTEAEEPEIPLPDGLFLYRTEIGGRPYRAAVVAETEKKALAAIERTEPFNNGAAIAAKRLKALARQGIHLNPEDSAAPPLAFVFPGQGSHYAGMAHELYQTFPVIREWMDRAAEVADFDILRLMFHDREEDLQKTRWQQPALFTMEYAMVQYLVSLGIRPTALAGHSLGELTALCLAGVYSFEDGFRIVNKRAVCMDKACNMNVDPGIMVACDAPLDLIEEMLAQRENVFITNLNSPHQIVIGGDTEASQAMGLELKAAGHRSTQLRVSMAFHSPVMACIRDELQAFVDTVEFHPPRIPVVSNTTMKPYPDDGTEIGRIIMAHLESPVQWMHNVKTLWDDFGVRIFVEVGPREILSNLIADTLEDAECIQTCLPSAESVVYKTALAQLYARGNFKIGRKPRFVAFPGAQKAPEPLSLAAARAGKGLVPQAPGPVGVEQIIQREINSFVLETFGRFLRPAILAAVRKHYDPSYHEEQLDRLLLEMYPAASLPHGTAPMPLPAPAATATPIQVPPAAVAAVRPGGEPGPGRQETDVTEGIIRIIMEATGYEREEIEADMDLREDLSIRSSRLPVIMDALEGNFGIKIELEEFMDVRTIRDISDKISAILDREEKKGKKGKKDVPAGASAGGEMPAPATREERTTIKRAHFCEIPVETGEFQPIELAPVDSVAVFCPGGEPSLHKDVGDVIRRDYGVNIIHRAFLGKPDDPELAGSDLRTDGGAGEAVRSIADAQSLAGMVFILDDALEEKVKSMEEVSVLLKGFFSLLRTFVDSSAKKFVILLHKSEKADGVGSVLADGLLGMFLSAGLELSSVQFRTVRLDAGADLRDGIRGALNRNCKPVQLIHRDGEVFTLGGSVAPLLMDDTPRFELGPKDVVVFSGGGYGITRHQALSLVPFGCRMVILGRTALDPSVDYRKLLSEQGAPEEAVGRMLDAKKPGLTAEERTKEISRIVKALDAIRTVEELRSLGIEASYFSCDVTDANRVKTVFDGIVKRFGAITGIVHGAGFLIDRLLKEMTPADFSAVVDVKFRGALNLYEAARGSGLRFVVCFSSAAGIQGNPGQSNYAAGNRMMASLMSYLRSQNPSVRFKALILPPIEGAGMAENAEIRALMKRMNAGYIHVDELAGLFGRELCLGPVEDDWVLFLRSLPDLPTVRLDFSEPATPEEEIRAEGLAIRKQDFPMIDSVTLMDLSKGVLEATRTFSQERDLWIADHKPFKFLKHPLVSAIMALETFMEAAQLLYPHLKVQAVHDARFLDIIECGPGMSRTSEISCRRVGGLGKEVVCEVDLSTSEVSPSGRVLDRKGSNYKARVILGGVAEMPQQPEGFPVSAEELETRPMELAEVLQWYEDRSDMQGRYRVMQHLDGTAPGAIRGHFIYRRQDDFSGGVKPNYQYSPYLLEALMQAVNFYIVMRDQSEQRSMIPQRIGEMIFAGSCKDGDKIFLEGRMRAQSDEALTWNARAVDESGRALMVVRDLVMRWFSK